MPSTVKSYLDMWNQYPPSSLLQKSWQQLPQLKISCPLIDLPCENQTIGELSSMPWGVHWSKQQRISSSACVPATFKSSNRGATRLGNPGTRRDGDSTNPSIGIVRGLDPGSWSISLSPFSWCMSIHNQWRRYIVHKPPADSVFVGFGVSPIFNIIPLNALVCNTNNRLPGNTMFPFARPSFTGLLFSR